MIRAVLLLSAAVLSGCGGTAADHELLGDRAVGEGKVGLAVAEYQAATRNAPRPRVWAKLASTAMADGRFGLAADALERLAREDPSRAAEAAAALERTAQLALRADPPDAAAATRALLALRLVAPDRPVGLLALNAARRGGLGPGEATRLLPAAIGAAGSARVVDSLLVALGSSYRATTACEDAVGVLRTALRRRRDGAVRGRAAGDLAACALQLGIDALTAEDPVVAETWFLEAIRADSLSDAGRRARLGFGDARLRQGDILGAAIAWQQVLFGATSSDSLAALATERMNGLRGETPPPQEGTP